MRILCPCLILVSSVWLTPVAAQEAMPPQPAGEAGLTTIAMTQSLTVPLNDGDDQLARQQEAMRSFYQLVGGACATVRETIAESCEITNITFSFRSNERPQQLPARPDTVRIDGQIQMLVRLKEEVGPPSAENSRRPPQRPVPSNRF